MAAIGTVRDVSASWVEAFSEYRRCEPEKINACLAMAAKEGPQTLWKQVTRLPFNLVITKEQQVYAKYKSPAAILGSVRRKKEAVDLLTGQVVARLVSNQPDQETQVKIQREYDLLSQFKGCRGIAQVHSLVVGRNKKQEETWTLFEFNYVGDAFSFLDRGLKFNQDQQARFFPDLLAGLQTIHRNQCVHRDIKIENVFLGPDAVIGDFNLALKFENANAPFQGEFEGAFEFLSPEKAQAILYQAYERPYQWTYADEQAADVWNLGLVFYFMRHGIEKYKIAPTDLNKVAGFVQEIASRSVRTYFSEAPLKGSIDWWISCMLLPSAQRPTIEQLVRQWSFS